MIYIALAAAVLIVVADQVTKMLVVSNLSLGESFSLIRGLLDINYTENDGMALGIGSESYRWVFVAVMIIIGSIMIALMFKPGFKSKLYFASTALIVGGGLGNMIDRVFRGGKVVDFLSLSFFSPICNIADYAITIGTALLIVYIVFFYGKKEKQLKAERQSAEALSAADSDRQPTSKDE